MIGHGFFGFARRRRAVETNALRLDSGRRAFACFLLAAARGVRLLGAALGPLAPEARHRPRRPGVGRLARRSLVRRARGGLRTLRGGLPRRARRASRSAPRVPGDDPQPSEQRVGPEKAARPRPRFGLGVARIGEPLEVRQRQTQRRQPLAVVGARADAALSSCASGHQLLQQRHAALAGALEHAAREQKQRRTVGAVGGDAGVVEVIPKRGGRGNRPERGDGFLVRRESLLVLSTRFFSRVFPTEVNAMMHAVYDVSPRRPALPGLLRESRRRLASRSPRLLGCVQRRSPREVRSLLHLVRVQRLQVRRVRLHRLAHDAQLIPCGAAPRLRGRVLARAGRPAGRHRGRHRRERRTRLSDVSETRSLTMRAERARATRPRRETRHRRGPTSVRASSSTHTRRLSGRRALCGREGEAPRREGEMRSAS